jgi:hypothetical protein
MYTLYPIYIKKKKVAGKLVAHACNPSYSGGRDQEAHSSRPARANSFLDPSQKKKNHKKGVREWLKS